MAEFRASSLRLEDAIWMTVRGFSVKCIATSALDAHNFAV